MQRLNMSSIAAKLQQRLGNNVVCSIHDYQPITATLVKVVATFNTFDGTQEEMASAVNKLFKGKAQAITSSFRQIKGSGLPAAIGFIRANTEVREYDQVEVAKMKVVASNLLMSADDENLWEVRSSGNAKYLTRQSKDDLSELVVMAKVRAANVPKLNHIAVASIQQSEFVAFVDKTTEEMRYGFVVKASDESLEVVDVEGDEAEVTPDMVVESAYLKADLADYAITAGIESPLGNDKQAMIDFYKEVYAYDADYMNQMVDIINQHAAL